MIIIIKMYNTEYNYNDEAVILQKHRIIIIMDYNLASQYIISH